MNNEVTAGWKNMDSSMLCAFINDALHMQEKCDEFCDKTLDLIPQQDQYEVLAEQANAVSKEFINIANVGVSYLARYINITLSI